MEDGIVLEANAYTPRRRKWVLILIVVDNGLVLLEFPGGCFEEYEVLILVVVDNGLVQLFLQAFELMLKILILIVVEDGLVLERFGLSSVSKSSLNPYYSGRWSRTMHDWRKFAWKKGS